MMDSNPRNGEMSRSLGLGDGWKQIFGLRPCFDDVWTKTQHSEWDSDHTSSQPME